MEFSVLYGIKKSSDTSLLEANRIGDGESDCASSLTFMRSIFVDLHLLEFQCFRSSEIKARVDGAYVL